MLSFLLGLGLVAYFVSNSTRRGFSTTFISSLAALLDNHTRHLETSKVHLLWVFTTILIVDIYSGSITSEVIAPPDDIQFTKTGKLKAENYIIIFPGYLYANALWPH